jgi:probable HAF family extracellular repeat protein
VAGFADTLEPDPFPGFCFGDDCFVSHTFEWKDGVKTDLGALPGGGSSASNWVSANGLIAGFSQNGLIDPLIPGLPEVHAVLWRNANITDLGTLPEGGFESIASAINSGGQVVGLGINTIADPDSMIGIGFQTRAFLWQGGKMQDLGTLGTGTNAQAILINEKGQVVGWSYVNSVPTNLCIQGFAFATGSFIWEKEHGMRDLGSLGGSCTTASDMNSLGQVVGFSNLPGDMSQHGFLWDNGSFQDLGGSLGGDFQGPFAVNEHGQAVGFASLPDDSTIHAVLWKGVGRMTDLGGVDADRCSLATSINSKTQVVGTSGDCTSTSRVFLWEDGVMSDLNALLSRSSSLHLEFTESINDRGEIAGTGVESNGNQHAFLAIPCDQEHPNIEGCDYSLAEGSRVAPTQAVVAAPLTGNQQRLAPGNAQNQIPALLRNRNRRFGSIGLRLSSIGTTVGSPQQVTLSGIGTTAKLSPGSLGFVATIGKTSSPQTVTLTNVGTNRLIITGIAITGTDPGDFMQTHTCGSSLTGGTSCSINVTFKPTTSGIRTAALSITDNGGGSPQTVTLTGNGIKACIPQGGECYGPGPNHCCPTGILIHHAYCSNPTGWGTCTES